MNIVEIAEGLFRIEREGTSYLGIEIGPSRARIGSSLTSLQGSVARIFAPSLPNTQVTWTITGHMSHDDKTLVFGPWLDVAGTLSDMDKAGIGDALNSLSTIASALEVLPGQNEIFEKGLLLAGFIRLKDERLLMLPHKVQELMLSLQPPEKRFAIYEAYHHPSLRGLPAYRFGFAVLAYKIACKSLPWKAGAGAVDYAHRILAGSFAGPGAFLETSSQELESAAARVLASKNGVSQAGDLKAFIDELSRCAEGQGDPAVAEAAKQSQKKRDKSFKKHSSWRKNRVRIGIIAAIAVLVAIIPSTIISKQFRTPRTAGLSPDAVVKAFFQGFDELDTELMEDAVSPGIGSAALGTVTNYFVVDRVRGANEGKQTRMKPDEWIELGKPLLSSSLAVFGIAGLQVEELVDQRQSTSRSYDVHYEFYYPAQMDPNSSYAKVEVQKRHQLMRVAKAKNRENFWQIVDIKDLP